MAPLSGHLSLLWDHLVRRALASEPDPSSRAQHLLDDLDLLLATASDFLMSCCAVCPAAEAEPGKDGQFTLSLSLAAALVMEKGQWSLKKEEDAPTKFRPLFALRPEDAEKARQEKEAERGAKRKANGPVPSTFEERFAKLECVSVSAAAAVNGSEEKGEKGKEAEARVRLTRLDSDFAQSQTSRVRKMDFEIVGDLFVCRVPNCAKANTEEEDEEGFYSLRDLKDHFDEVHAGEFVTAEELEEPAKKRRRRKGGIGAGLGVTMTAIPAPDISFGGRTRKPVQYKEEFSDDYESEAEFEEEEEEEEEEEDQKDIEYFDGGDDIGDADYIENETEDEEEEDEDDKDDSDYVAEEDEKEVKTPGRKVDLPSPPPPPPAPAEMNAKCHLCDFSCRFRLDLESHIRTTHPGHKMKRPRKPRKPRPRKPKPPQEEGPKKVIIDGVEMVREYKWQRLKQRAPPSHPSSKMKPLTRVRTLGDEPLGAEADQIMRQQQQQQGGGEEMVKEKLKLQCHVCDFSCRNRLDLESHTKTQHPGVDPFKCDRCEFSAKKKKYLLAHVRQRHLRAFKCNVCERRFAYKNHLETHMASHSDELTVMCHLCGKGFKCQKYLRKHLRCTHGDNAFLCGLCGRGFKHHSSYDFHMKKYHPQPGQDPVPDRPPQVPYQAIESQLIPHDVVQQMYGGHLM